MTMTERKGDTILAVVGCGVKVMATLLQSCLFLPSPVGNPVAGMPLLAFACRQL